MRTTLRAIVAAGAALMIGLMPMAAYADKSLGIYQTTDRKMDYAASICGNNDSQMCIKLVAVRGSADIPRTRKWLNKYVVDHAKPDGGSGKKWKGTMNISGYTVTGTIQLRNSSIVLRGCTLAGMLCEDFRLVKAKK